MFVRTRGMAAEIGARLRVMIDEGELPSGARIDEKELCVTFDVSKTPLREALKVLVSEGLVTHRQYIGYRVAPSQRNVRTAAWTRDELLAVRDQ